MERRYLVAALAIIATFAVFSRALRTLERVSLTYGRDVEANAKAKCNADASAASRFIGKVRTHLRPAYPEEAQLLAEMDLPIVMAQVKVAEQITRQNMAAAQCARATALRETERAQREATRMREKWAHPNGGPSPLPIAWTVSASDVDQQVRTQTAALAERIAAQSVRWQVAAERMRDVSDSEAEQDADNNGGSRARCNAVQQDKQTAQALRARSRAMVREVEHSLGYR
jgi:hypothetical protein